MQNQKPAPNTTLPTCQMHRYLRQNRFNVVKADGNQASIAWSEFARILNDHLTDHLSIAEDRLLGPWFVSDVELASSDFVPGKVLIYLWDDLLRHHGRDIIFNTAVVKTYSRPAGSLFSGSWERGFDLYGSRFGR